MAVVGSKKSGKTTTIEALIRGLAQKGYAVAAIKHIPERDFTIDKEGKDTWRFAQSGAKTVICVSSAEVATIEKVNTDCISLKAILKKCSRNDIVLIEGLRGQVEKDKSIRKIVAVKSAEEASNAARRFRPILAFTGPYSTIDLDLGIPYVDVLRTPKEIAEIVEKEIRKKKQP